MTGISTIMPWSPVKMLNGRACRMGFPNTAFWNLWRVDKDGIKRIGIEVKKHDDGNFVAYWWNPPEQAEPARTVEPTIKLDESLLPESIRAKLRSYQIQPTLMTIRALTRPPYRFLNASGLGSGKTYTSCAAALAIGRRIVVVCRLAAMPAWREVACEHFGFQPHEVIVVNREKLRTGRTGLISKVTKHEAGRSWKEWEWTLPKNHLLIMDEIHADSGITTANGEMLIAAVRQELPILGLSATAADEPLKMRALGYFLGLHGGDEYFYRWLYKLGCTKGDYGFVWNFGYSYGQITNNAMIREEVEKKRVETMAGIHQDVKSRGIFVRLKTSEIPNFPKTQIIPVKLDFNAPELEKIYQEMQRELSELNQKTEGRKGVSEMEIMMRARQRAELIKIPVLADEVLDVIDEGGSCAVFLNFRDSVQALAQKLGTDCIFEGGMPEATRNRNLKAFQADDSRVFICNTQAGGESIGLHDLHGRYPRTAYIMPTFWLVMLLQALGRVCRDGALTPSIQKIPFAAGTVEEEAYKAVMRRKRQADAFNGEFTPTEADLQAGIFGR